MSFILISLIVAALALLTTYLYNLYTYWQRRGVPHERPLPILGNMYGIGRSVHFRDVNQRLYDRFKGKTPFAGMYLFLTKAAFVMDLELIKSVLIKDFSNFHDRSIFHNERDDPLTGHLLALEGEHWRAMRTKLTPVFTSGKMKFMLPTVVKVAEHMVPACESIAKEDAEGALEVKELCARYTTDVIGTCAFGIECNSLQDPNAEFRCQGRSIFGNPRHSQIVQAFMLLNPSLARKLRMRLFSDSVSKFFLDAVRRTVEYRMAHNVKRNDFMDMLIELKAKDEERAKESNGIDLAHGLTFEQLAAQAFVFFVAGFDTSSTTMAFCLYELALNSQIQDKLRAEIVQVLAEHKNELTYEAMMEMHYLEQVLSETLRKHPVLPHLIRKAVEDFRLVDSNHIIEKGTTVIIPIEALHNDPSLYPNPEKFDPARFEPEAIKQRPAMAYLPFGEGPRHCIGMRFGQMQAKIGLITLLKSFKFTPSKRTEIPIKLSKKNFLATPENGIYLHIERI